MYLMHHGRKGQKWGVENGPPYPLDKTNQEYKQDVDKKQQIKKALIIGGITVGGLLAVYGGYRIAKDLRIRNLNRDLEKVGDFMVKDMKYPTPEDIRNYHHLRADQYQKHGYKKFANIYRSFADGRLDASQLRDKVNKLAPYKKGLI